MKVFNFVATDVNRWLKGFLDELPPGAERWFCPHQANPYMIRQLAKSLALSERLVTLPEEIKNPGSCSIPFALKTADLSAEVLIAGFGAGYSASAGIVKMV